MRYLGRFTRHLLLYCPDENIVAPLRAFVCVCWYVCVCVLSTCLFLCVCICLCVDEDVVVACWPLA